MTSQCRGKISPAFHRQDQLFDDPAKGRILLLFENPRQRHRERNAGVDHHGQLIRDI